MSLLEHLAPDFTAQSVIVKNGEPVIEEFTLSSLKDKKYVLLFFYPLDFTFVCPTELHAFQEALPEFESRNVEVVGCSVDSHFSHYNWLKSSRKEGGIEGVTYRLVSDLSRNISRSYQILKDESISYRGTFLIDKSGTIQIAHVNNLQYGRSVDEYIRLVDAIQTFENVGEVCPANWSKGERTMKADDKGLKEYFAQ